MRRLVIFSHYDIDNIIDDYVIHYLTSLQAASCDIIFVSTSQLSERELAKVSPICSKTLYRENLGYDFMSYKVGILETGIDILSYDEILICNDSVYGPFCDLSHIFETMASRKCDFWGMTSTLENSPHIQSYFILFKRNIIQSKAFHDFFANVTILNDKKDIIEFYEIGLTKWFVSNGFVYDSYCKQVPFLSRCIAFLQSFKTPRQLSPNSIKNKFRKIVLHDMFNPTLFYWKELIEHGGPFLKIELLRKNPLKLKNTSSILRYIQKTTNYHVHLIENHLHRTMCKY